MILKGIMKGIMNARALNMGTNSTIYGTMRPIDMIRLKNLKVMESYRKIYVSHGVPDKKPFNESKKGGSSGGLESKDNATFVANLDISRLIPTLMRRRCSRTQGGNYL